MVAVASTDLFPFQPSRPPPAWGLGTHYEAKSYRGLFCGNDPVNQFDANGNSWFSKWWDHTILSLGKHIAQNWDHGRQYVIAAVAVIAAIVTYGAASEWAIGELTYASALAETGSAAAADMVAATASALGTSFAAGTTIGIESAVIGGAAAGAVGGAVGTALAGGNLSQIGSAALRGAAGGAIFGAIGGYYGNTWGFGRVVDSTIAGGLSSEINGGSFRLGAEIAGTVALVTWGALEMRQYEIDHSNPRDLGRPSVGFNGSGDSLAGSRSTVEINPLTGQAELVQIPLPFGGSQGSAIGYLFGSPYADGSWKDYLLEAYAGPHDFLGDPWGYDSAGFNDAPNSLFGRIIANVAGIGVANHVSDLMGGVDLFIASPIVATSVVGISPGGLSATTFRH